MCLLLHILYLHKKVVQVRRDSDLPISYVRDSGGKVLLKDLGMAQIRLLKLLGEAENPKQISSYPA